MVCKCCFGKNQEDEFDFFNGFLCGCGGEGSAFLPLAKYFKLIMKKKSRVCQSDLKLMNIVYANYRESSSNFLYIIMNSMAIIV